VIVAKEADRNVDLLRGTNGHRIPARKVRSESLSHRIDAGEEFPDQCSVDVILVTPGASWIPARRAAGVDPMRALRHE
jgi:hypothetical protein